jgi:low temperature requirement protein LtrA
VVRRDASVRRTWRPTVWIYTHLPLAAALAASGVAVERAVAEAGHGPMSDPDRWLLVGSVALAFGAMALIQLASNTAASVLGRTIILARAIGIPILAVLGLMSDLEPQWLVLGVLGLCVAQVLSEIVAAASPENPEDELGE